MANSSDLEWSLDDTISTYRGNTSITALTTVNGINDNVRYGTWRVWDAAVEIEAHLRLLLDMWQYQTGALRTPEDHLTPAIRNIASVLSSLRSSSQRLYSSAANLRNLMTDSGKSTGNAVGHSDAFQVHHDASTTSRSMLMLLDLIRQNARKRPTMAGEIQAKLVSALEHVRSFIELVLKPLGASLGPSSNALSVSTDTMWHTVCAVGSMTSSAHDMLRGVPATLDDSMGPRRRQG